MARNKGDLEERTAVKKMKLLEEGRSARRIMMK
jgi:hypothetical protein